MAMRFWVIPVLAGLLLAVACGAGFAIPSLGGPTGIVSVPNASLAPAKSLETAFSLQNFRVLTESVAMYGGGVTTGHDDMTALSFQLLTGVSDEAELWAAYQSVRDGEDSHIWGIGGKFQVAKEPEMPVSVAVGASFQKWIDVLAVDAAARGAGVDPDATVKKAFAVATRDLTPIKDKKWAWGPGGGTRILASAGLLYLKVSGASLSDSLTRPFLGLEFVSPNGTTVGLEYRMKDSSIDEKAVMSAVLRYRFSPEFSAEIGTTNANPVGTGMSDEDMFLRLGYTIPFQAAY